MAKSQEPRSTIIMTNHWADLLTTKRGLDTLYDTVPPLESVRLRSFHLSWRGPTIIARVDLPTYPENPLREWFERDHDTLQIHVQFLAMDELIVRGWIPSSPVDFSFSRLDRRRLLTRITGAGLEVSFTCSDSLGVGHISSFRSLASRPEGEGRSFLQPLDARRFSALPETFESTYYERV
ncbi:Imm50 family immunity protein [Streptomyces anulatus]|uniref:Imm50 family immunity protein n=2 Tax=Streptomyces TaxID=1883 RepID=UPI00099836CF